MLPPNILNGLKTLISSALVLSSLVIVVVGLAWDTNIADMGGTVPECILLFLSLLLLAMNEGFQVGVVSIQHFSSDVIKDMGYHRAAKTHSLMFEQDSGRLKQLLIGQSFMVVTCSFLIAQLTAFPYLTSDLLFSSSSSSSIVSSIFFIFVQSGLPGVIITVTFAQLLPSIFSKQYPLQFLNIFGVHTIIRLALMIENIGIVKFVYVIFYCFKMCFDSSRSNRSKCRRNSKDRSSLLDSSFHNIFSSDMEDDILEYGDESEENDNDKEDETAPHKLSTAVKSSSMQNRIDIKELEGDLSSTDTASPTCGHCRILMDIVLTFVSFCLTVFSILFLAYGIYHGFSTFGEGIHPVLQFVVLFFVLLIVFYCEGLKIAIVSTSHLDHIAVQAKGGNQNAVQIHQLLHPPPPSANSNTNSTDTFSFFDLDSSGGGVSDMIGQEVTKTPEVDHVKRFLLGRQQIVVPLGFLFAQFTHFSSFPSAVLPPVLFYPLVTIGVPGILVLLQFAQLAPQLLAEEQNISFLGMRGAYSLTRVALFIESLGVTNFTWLLFACLDRMMQSSTTTVDNEGYNEDDEGDDDENNEDQLVNNINIELGNMRQPSSSSSSSSLSSSSVKSKTKKAFSLMSGGGSGGGRKKKNQHTLLPIASPVRNSSSVTV